MNTPTQGLPVAIPWYKSNTLRALLVAMIAQLAVVFGLTDKLPDGQAASIADGVLMIVEFGALLWAAYARARQPTPPVTLRKETP